jgi:endonuclease/exonuclease/phosphatase family metal-dependent hydrolase
MREHVNLILDVRTAAAGLACRAPLRVAVFALAFAIAPAVHAEDEAPMRLRILSWNVWGLPAASTNLEPRMAALPDAIARLHPDVILLQEVWAESDGDALKRGLARHGYRYASHLAHTEAGMTGLFTASKLPLKNVGFLPFASGRIGHSFWHLEWVASKGVGSFLLETPLGEVELQNTHLQAQYDTDNYAAERLSQASEILCMNQDRRRSLVLGGDFNTGAEELPRKALLDLDGLTDTTPSPEPDTVFVRSGGTTQIRVVGSHLALTEAVVLQNGVKTELSDHPAVVVDLELSACTGCAPATANNLKTRETAHAALLSAVAITPSRVSLAISAAASLFAVAVLFFRRTRALHNRSWRHRTLRRTGLVVLATGFVWTMYLGSLYYPARAKALRLVAAKLETLPLR